MKTRVSFSCLIVGLVACAFAAAAELEVVPVKPADIAGKRYVLYSVDGITLSGESKPYIQFDADLNMAGIVCNRFRGPATLENGILRSPGVVSTRMMCTQEDLSKLEAAFFKQLENGMVLRVEGEDLFMQNAEIDLQFQSDYQGAEQDAALAAALAGKRFVLKTMGGQEFQADGVPTPYIQFDQGLKVSGSVCNQFTGQGRLRQGQLRVDQLASTLRLCADPHLQQFEGLFHMMLRNGGSVALDGNTLHMNGQGLQLVFELTMNN